MGVPATPTNFNVQQANGNVYISWNYVPGATTYQIQRSSDGGNQFPNLIPPISQNVWLDTQANIGTLFYYQVYATNSSGNSTTTTPIGIVPCQTGQMSLFELRLRSQQRADRVNSTFVSTSEWNNYINQSYFELYDLLVDTYEDYYLKSYQFTTDGTNNTYALPADFYKAMGVDIGLATSNNARVTVKKFEFIGRNRYVYPNITSTFLGVFNLEYRIMGGNIMLIPTPSSGQIMTLWYIPRLTMLLADSDLADGISGWTEYIITDAAIKALQKEESDTSVLMMQKQALIKRIEDSAMNRDAGQPDCISNTRTWGERWGAYGGPGFDGNFGGY